MKQLICSLAFVAVIFLASAQERVLFVGNSLTYYNDMPAIFENIALDKGHRVVVESYAIGGTGLAEMFASGEVVQLIESEHWDKMVLQPGTGESAGSSIATDSTSWVVRQLVDALHAVNPEAKVCLYEISNGISQGNGSGDYDYYLYTQRRILDTVTKIARLAGVPFAPAGECFREHYATHHDLMLHSVFNDIHPNAAGSYLVACAIFETLFEETIAPCGYHGALDEGQAEYLQQIADTVVLPNRERWLMGEGEDPETPEEPEDPENPLGITVAVSENCGIYPNPTRGVVHTGNTGEVVIYGMEGNRQVMSVHSGVIDLTGYSPGIYILQVGGVKYKVVVCR